MSDNTILQLYRTLQMGFQRTQSALSAVLPAAGSAFNPILSTLNEEIAAKELVALERAFNFNGPESAELMRCYSLACDLHRINPTQFTAPPRLARPPVVDNPISVAELQMLYRLNCQSLPEKITYSVDAYTLTVARALVSHESVLTLYGEVVRINGGSLPLRLTVTDAVTWLQSVLEGDIITDPAYWVNDAWFDEHLVAVDLLNQAALDDDTTPHAVVRQLQQHRLTYRRAKQSGDIPDDYVWSWMRVRYAILDQAPHLLDHWIPVGDAPDESDVSYLADEEGTPLTLEVEDGDR